MHKKVGTLKVSTSYYLNISLLIGTLIDLGTALTRVLGVSLQSIVEIPLRDNLGKGKGKGTRYFTSEVPLLSREYSPRKPSYHCSQQWAKYGCKTIT